MNRRINEGGREGKRDEREGIEGRTKEGRCREKNEPHL